MFITILYYFIGPQQDKLLKVFESSRNTCRGGHFPFGFENRDFIFSTSKPLARYSQVPNLTLESLAVFLDLLRHLTTYCIIYMHDYVY